MAGLLDFLNSPAGIGLLSAVAGGAAGARQGTPWNNAGRGALAGLQGYQGAQNQLKADAEDAVNRQFKQSQADKIQAEIARKNAMQTASAQAAQASFKQPVDAQYAVDGNAGNADFANMAADQNQFINDAQGSHLQEQPTQTRQAQAGGFDPSAYKQNMLTQLAQSGMADEAMKYAPEPVKYGDVKFSGDGRSYMQGNDGSIKFVNDITPRDKLVADNLGGTQVYRTEYSATPVATAARTATPDAVMSNERAISEGRLNRGVTIRGQNISSANAAAGRAATSQGNKPPSGYRYKPNGDLEMIPGGPADTKKQMQLEGGSTVDTVIATLRDQYNKLEDNGGITSPQNRFGSNIVAGVSSSGVGQSLGRMLGTDNQSSRNTIAQTRPILLQAIMKATGMSSKQMDSNAELKLYLATATDPTLDIASNRRALDMIDKLYGSGAGTASPPTKPPKDLPTKPPANSNAGSLTNPIRVSSDADYNNVPKGKYYTAPDGTTRLRK